MIESQETYRKISSALQGACSGLPLFTFLLFLVKGLPALHPTFADVAVIESWLRAMPNELPLFGVYSRLGWFHPGPALYYALWPIYKIFGGSTDALHLAAWVHNVFFATLALLYQRRLDRSAAPSFGIVLAVLIAFWGPTVLSLPWNPYLALMPLVLFIVLVASILEHPDRGLAALVLVGSYLVQLHVSYLVIVTGAVVVALGRRAQQRVRPRWALHSAILWTLVLLLWIPPAIALARGVPGNLWTMVSALSKSSAAHTGTLRESLEFLGELPSWLLGLQASPYPMHAHEVPTLSGASALGVGILGALCAVTIPRRPWARSFYVIGMTLLLWAVASVLLVTGPALRYLFVWVPVVPGLFLWLQLYRILQRMRERSNAVRIGVQTSVALICLAAAVRSVDPQVILSRNDPNASMVKDFSDCAERTALVLGHRWVHIIPEGGQCSLLLISVRNELSKRGFDATTEWSFTALPASDKGTTPGHSYFVMRTGEPASGDSLLCQIGDVCLSLRRAPMVEYGRGWGPWERGDFRWARRKDAELIIHHANPIVLLCEIATAEFMTPRQELRVLLEDEIVRTLRFPASPWTWVTIPIQLQGQGKMEADEVHFECEREWKEAAGTRTMVFPMRNATIANER